MITSKESDQKQSSQAVPSSAESPAVTPAEINGAKQDEALTAFTRDQQIKLRCLPFEVFYELLCCTVWLMFWFSLP